MRQERPRRGGGAFPGGHVIDVPLEGVAEEAEEGQDAEEREEEEALNESDSEGDNSGSSVGSQTTGSRSCDVGWDHGAQVSTIKEEGDEEEWEEEEWEEDWGGHYGGGYALQASKASGLSATRLSLVSDIEIKATTWIRSEQADLFFGAVIAVNALVIGMEVEAELRWGEESVVAMVLYWLQCVFALVFVAELLLRTRAVGIRQICRNMEGVFDAFVVLITVVDLWVVNPLVRFTQVIGGHGQKSLDALSMLRILQLLRLVRIIRLLRVSRQLSLLVLGLAKSLRSVLWVFLMLFVVIYIGALFCASELGTSDDPNLQATFGTLWSSMYSHFKIMTLEAWPDICGWAMEQNALWAAYFIGYILITNLALVNLVTGLIMDGVLQGAKTEDWSSELMVVEAGPFVQTVRDIIGDKDKNHDRYLDPAEFKNLLADPFFQEVLEVYGISLRIEPDEVFELLDIHGVGLLSIEELAGSLLRLRGSRDALHPLLVRDDLHKESRRLLRSLKACEERISEHYDAEVQRVGDSLCSKLKELQFAASKETVSTRQHKGQSAPQKSVGFVEEAQEMQPAMDVPTKKVLHGSAPDQAVGERSEESAGAGEAARVVDLLRKVASRVWLLEDAVRKAEAELQASLAREAALEAALARSEPSHATQTVLDPETLELELVDEDRQAEAEAKEASLSKPLATTSPAQEEGAAASAEAPKPAGLQSPSQAEGTLASPKSPASNLDEASSRRTGSPQLAAGVRSQALGASPARSDQMLHRLRTIAAKDPPLPSRSK